MNVRRVRPDEHAAVGDLTIAAYDAVGAVSDEYRASLRDVAGRTGPGSRVLVAVERDVVVGAVTTVEHGSPHFEHSGHGDGGFRMLAVAPAHQGKGVGGELLDAVIEHARTAGWRRMVITSMAWMPSAHRLYERAGFTRRADLDLRFGSGVGLGFQLDLVLDAAGAFPPPGPVPDEVPVFVPSAQRPTGCG